ncbi:hypothetical protein DE146DRAFT_651154 [Phaeosphaeria sp. MPI-PUGE-AT-0046c]|nr:hypothetical protein DE146DRAFT_651154 [Phaeosphaeria sp. MPI-PUGE-AT-0046c]
MMVRLTPLRLLCAALALCVFFLTSALRALFRGERGFELLVERPPPVLTGPAPKVHYGQECSPFSAGVMSDVTVVLKIGAGQVTTQLPTYLNRLGRCKQDLLIFSDRKDSYNGFDIADALAHLRPEYKFNNPDFDIYDRIQNDNVTEETTVEGARLDKYKYLPMMEWTSYMRPDSQWFVFVELDTYVNYDNLYRFLTHFNPRSAHYFGSPVFPKKKKKKKVPYAHGGSGFVLSRGALERIMAFGRMFGENKHFPGTHFFGQDIKTACCGDEVLAQVLKKSGVPLRGYWPMFNGLPPNAVGFKKEQWCEAIITMHGLHDDDFTRLGKFREAQKHPDRPLTFEDLYTIAEPHIQEKVDDWSNLSADKEYGQGSTPAKSFDKCHRACLQDGRCMQFEYTGLECRIQHSIRLGHHQPPDGERKWMSGWITSRVDAFKKAHSPCQGAHFVHSHP